MREAEVGCKWKQLYLNNNKNRYNIMFLQSPTPPNLHFENDKLNHLTPYFFKPVFIYLKVFGLKYLVHYV